MDQGRRGQKGVCPHPRLLLAKSCHDIDWLNYIVGRRCFRVSSFGSLYYFKPENRPEGAADRCMDCALSKKCPYSAKEFYFRKLRNKELCWPLDVVDPTFRRANLAKALREGPYGRCVFACDNDVVDHQEPNGDRPRATSPLRGAKNRFLQSRRGFARIGAAKGKRP